jgi:hypothetical protein
MPTPGLIGVTPGSGINLDSVTLTVNSQTVYREIVTLGDPTTGTNYAGVTSLGSLQVDITSIAGNGALPLSVPGALPVLNLTANEFLALILFELRAIKTILFTQDPRLLPTDFAADNFQDVFITEPV